MVLCRYMAPTVLLEMMARMYEKEGDTTTAKSIIAWPALATTEELKGLPPSVISVNECDPLASEGIAFYRQLTKAGVQAQGKVLLGAVHDTSLYATLVPDLAKAQQEAVASFVKSL